MITTPAMLNWTYAAALNKTEIRIGPGARFAGTSYGVSEELSGIDRMIGTVRHEERHVVRIAAVDPLVPVAPGTSFQYGWSYGGSPVNHFNMGSDAAWGDLNVDEDGNGITDDAAPAPPFEPGTGTVGNGIDTRLSGTGRLSWWPTTQALPVPDLAPWPEESEAVNFTDTNMDEHDNARADWSNPGKNHLTLDRFDD